VRCARRFSLTALLKRRAVQPTFKNLEFTLAVDRAAEPLRRLPVITGTAASSTWCELRKEVVHRLRMPLDLEPLDHVSSYLFVEERVLVDAGPYSEEAYSTLVSELESLELKLGDLKAVVVTHTHVDHVGMLAKLMSTREFRAEVLIHRRELASLEALSKGLGRAQATRLRELGAPSKVAKQVEEELKRWAPVVKRVYEAVSMRARPVRGGEAVEAGGLKLRLLSTPGHSVGHICVYRPREKLLATGDHVLPTITPNVSELKRGARPMLKRYLDSLRKLEGLKVSLALPAHGEPFPSLHLRVRELIEHHRRRAEDVLEELRSRPSLSAYEVASRLRWDVPYASWEELPAHQKYLAVGEALAHLRLLEFEGLVREEVGEDGVRRYTAVS